MDENNKPNEPNDDTNRPSGSSNSSESLSKRLKRDTEAELQEAPSSPEHAAMGDSPNSSGSEQHMDEEAEEEEDEDDINDFDSSSSSSDRDSNSSSEWEDAFEARPSRYSHSASSSASSSEDDVDAKQIPLFSKPKPKHKWFVVRELDRRQLGRSAKLRAAELFHRDVCGSLRFVQRLELMYKMEEHGGCVNSLHFHPDGSLLASGSDDLSVVLWDWKLGRMLAKYKTRHVSNVFQAKFLPLPGDLHLVSSARDGQVRLAQVAPDGALRSSRVLGLHRGACHKLMIMSEQPQVVLSAGEDGVVLSHDVRTPHSSRLLKVIENKCKVALYSIHGHPLRTTEYCVSGKSSLVRIYDQRFNKTPIGTHTPFKAPQSQKYHVTCAVYNHDGSELLASYSDQDIYLFDTKDAEKGKFIHQYQGHRNNRTIKGVSFFGPKSEYVVSGSDCGNMYFWDRDTESVVQWLLADDARTVNCLEPHPQLPFICTSGLDWDVKVWVPSCEEDPTMKGLINTVKSNYRLQKSGGDDMPDFSDTQMLWMWFREWRNNGENTRVGNPDRSSDSDDGVDNSDIDLVRACRTS